MKKNILVLAVLLSGFCSFSQKAKAWFEAGIKGGGGLSLIVNNNEWNDKNTCAPALSGCYSYGGRLAVNFTENHQIAFEGLWGMRSQDFTFRIDKVNYDKTIKMNVNDLAMFYRFNGGNGGYVELGGQYTLISNATEKSSAGTVDIKDNFTSYTSAVIGFGGNLAQSGSFTWTAGIRIAYAFTDALSDHGGAGQDYSYPLNDPVIRKSYPTYKATKPITMQLMTEFNFDLGYFAKSNCKRGRISFMSF